MSPDGTWEYYSLHFVLLSDTVDKKMTELWYFPNLTYFSIWWPSYYLIFDLGKQLGPSLSQDAFVGEMWWRYGKAFVRYALYSIWTVKRTHLPKWAAHVCEQILLAQICIFIYVYRHTAKQKVICLYMPLCNRWYRASCLVHLEKIYRRLWFK